MQLKDIPSLAGRLQYIRQELDLSQSALAELAGTTQQAIQQAESGRARHPRYLPLLAQKTGIPFEWLSLNAMPQDGEESVILSLRENEVLDKFKDMDKKDQDLILDLMASRAKTKE